MLVLKEDWNTEILNGYVKYYVGGCVASTVWEINWVSKNTMTAFNVHSFNECCQLA
jgi:hypothetical protein